MSLTAYVWALRGVTLLAVLAFGGVILFLDPDEIGAFAQTLFWLLAGLALFGVGLLMFTGISRLVWGEEKTLAHLGATYRLSLGLLLMLALGLWLWRQNVLAGWSVGLVVTGLLLLELSYRSLFYKVTPRTKKETDQEEV